MDAVLDPRNDGTHNALKQHLDTGGFGALGVALLPEMLIIGNAENNLTEDGGNRMGVDLIFTVVSVTYRHTITGM